MREIAARSESFLEPYLTPIKATKLKRFKAYIQKRPRFRPIVKLRSEWLDQISADVSDEELDIELYKLMHRLEIEVRKDGVQLQSQQSQKTAESVDEHKKKLRGCPKREIAPNMRYGSELHEIIRDGVLSDEPDHAQILSDRPHRRAMGNPRLRHPGGQARHGAPDGREAVPVRSTCGR